MATVGTSTGYLDVNNYEEMQVTTGAYDITAQTGGVQINFVSKRGGNKLSRRLSTSTLEDKAWEMKHDAPEAPPITNYVTPGINRLLPVRRQPRRPDQEGQDVVVRHLERSGHPRPLHAAGDEAAYMLTNGYAKFNAQFGNNRRRN